MVVESTRRARSPGGERARLRAAVLRLGASLGWRRSEVIAFSSALIGRPWRRLREPELDMVLEEYRTLVRAIRAKAARRAAAPAGAVSHGDVGGRAPRA